MHQTRLDQESQKPEWDALSVPKGTQKVQPEKPTLNLNEEKVRVRESKGRGWRRASARAGGVQEMR